MFNSKHCQSCGMPIKKDEKGGGTESDGSKTDKYCSHCYEEGKFTEPNITANEMQEKVFGKMKDMGLPSFLSHMISNNIPKLERWKSS